jgi:hypothetical protein
LIEPEDLNEPISEAETSMQEKNVTLRLSLTDDMDSLPPITLLITDISQPILLENSINNTTYPHHLINIISVNCTYKNYQSIELSEVNTESIMDNFVGIVIVMSSLYWYYPHSIYAKVKLLLDNKDKFVVGSNAVPHYHLLQDPQSYIRESDVPSLDTCALRSRDTRVTRHQYLNMPFNFNCISISQSEPIGKFTTTNNIYSMIDFATQCIINKLYRSIYGR